MSQSTCVYRERVQRYRGTWYTERERYTVHRERYTENHRQRYVERHVEREANRERHRERQRERHRERHRESDRERYTERYTEAMGGMRERNKVYHRYHRRGETFMSDARTAGVRNPRN